MSAPGQTPPMPQGPGFITVILDIPFSLAIPNGQYTVFDPVKGMAIVQPVMKEGSRKVFRDTPVTGPPSFEDLKRKAQEYEAPRLAHSYVVVSRLNDGTEKATLNIHSGAGGGFAETKYYTEAPITFLEDDLGVAEDFANACPRCYRWSWPEYPAATMFFWTAFMTIAVGIPLVITPSKK